MGWRDERGACLIGEIRRVMEGLIDVVMEAVGEDNAGLV